MTVWHIRRATPADAERIAAANIAMALETEHLRLDPATALRGASHALADPARAVYYVAESHAAPVGQMMITPEWSDWRDGFFWWIQSVYVAPPARGAGVFRALYEHVRAEARRAADVCGLRLYVDDRNAGAQATYERVGMRRTGYLMYEECWNGP